jgi:hypothetical protein
MKLGKYTIMKNTQREDQTHLPPVLYKPTFENKNVIVTIIDSLLSLKHQCVTVTTVSRQPNQLIKKGYSPPKSTCIDTWGEFVHAWLLETNLNTKIPHYVCVRRLPLSSLWISDAQEQRDVRHLERAIKFFIVKFNMSNICVLSYNKDTEDFVDEIQDFIDSKEAEYDRFIHYYNKRV